MEEKQAKLRKALYVTFTVHVLIVFYTFFVFTMSGMQIVLYFFTLFVMFFILLLQAVIDFTK